jgi:large subunit ribosomal protein L20
MVRIKTNVYSHKRKKRVLKEARGQFGDRSKRYKEAAKSLTASKQYAYFDRKKKKGHYRSLWIVRLNAACREAGITYSRFINGLKNANITLDRKMLSEIAISSPEIFNQIVDQAKNAPQPKKTEKIVKTSNSAAANRAASKLKAGTTAAAKQTAKKTAPKKAAKKA